MIDGARTEIGGHDPGITWREVTPEEIPGLFSRTVDSTIVQSAAGISWGVNHFRQGIDKIKPKTQVPIAMSFIDRVRLFEFHLQGIKMLSAELKKSNPTLPIDNILHADNAENNKEIVSLNELGDPMSDEEEELSEILIQHVINSIKDPTKVKELDNAVTTISLDSTSLEEEPWDKSPEIIERMEKALQTVRDLTGITSVHTLPSSSPRSF